MLQPKKMKHRKWHKGRSRNRLTETRGVHLEFGKYGIQSLDSCWVTANQIEAVRKTLAHFFKKSGKVWIRIFPDKPVTQLPPEVTLGCGKGDVSHYVFPVKPGRILFEVDGIDEATAKRALKIAGHKLPVKTRIVSR